MLHDAEHFTGAVYLAGYAVECTFKAPILNAASDAVRPAVLATFRGSKAHDYEWLRLQFLALGGVQFPRDVRRHLAVLSEWSTDLRYNPRDLGEGYAADFMASAGAFVIWAKGRL